MASEYSFDVVSKIDLQEVSNAVQQSVKEIQTRFDLKGSKCDIQLVEGKIVLNADDEYKLKSIKDILEQKLVKRHVPLKGLTFGKLQEALHGTVKQDCDLQQGIPQEKAKEIVKLVKGTKLKVQASIQGDQVRISGRDKDALQSTMRMLRESDLGINMQFDNYR
ncbi:MAG: YajQ family cyclic di-GMP-binding protein [Acidobacteria bacterium]|nr:YajQ family cyclic di-GMP-binding protein [Acidobacteriota bacterium]